MSQNSKTVFVGLSGGVDSSVAALKLLEANYRVVGVFIKTWQPDFIECSWEKERLDAMRVAAKLNIPFLTCDAEEQYKNEVGKYMIEEYRVGRTPNPDVMCNKHVKFDTFLQFAMHHGADLIATGHYANIKERDGRYELYRGKDVNKDQSYFLWALTQEQLSKSLFPLGDMTKDEVRTKAKQAGLHTAKKGDSQGVCFLGEINMKEFLSHFTDTEPGTVLDEKGTAIGTHDGAIFYTIGQRHGFEVKTQHETAGALYVSDKNLEANTITVSDHVPLLAEREVALSHINEIGSDIKDTCLAQFRYRQRPFDVHVKRDRSGLVLSVPSENVETPSIGQSCVLYDGNRCLGGGTIEKVL